MDLAAALCAQRGLSIDQQRGLNAALESLDAREKRILELRYGQDGRASQSLREIGRALGISGERVRQLEKRALKMLGADDAPPGSPRAGAVKDATQPDGSLPGEALEAWTLLLLRGRPAHGYELSKRLGERGFASPRPRLYRLLHDLERRGLLRSDWAPSSAVGPRRRVYRLTSKGAHRLDVEADTLRSFATCLRLFFAHYASAAGGERSAGLAGSP